MRQAVMTISAMCIFIALCEQLLGGSIYMRTIRMALGLEIFLKALILMCTLFHKLK